MSMIPKSLEQKLNVYVKNNIDGSVRSKLYYLGEPKIENAVKVIVFYNNGNINCKHYYKNKMHHGLAQGFYRNGQLAKQIYFNNDMAIYGSYFKKDGREFKMSSKQLKARESTL